MSRIPIRIRHVATSSETLVVKTIRTDVAPGEPESLRAEQHVKPGEEITAFIYEGGAVLIAPEVPSHG